MGICGFTSYFYHNYQSIFGNFSSQMSQKPNPSDEYKPRLVKLPSKDISSAELLIGLQILAGVYKMPVKKVIKKLDKVSGNIRNLQRTLNGDHRCEWTAEEDSLLETNQELLVRWRGKEDVEDRKKYLAFDRKKQE